MGRLCSSHRHCPALVHHTVLFISWKCYGGNSAFSPWELVDDVTGELGKGSLLVLYWAPLSLACVLPLAAFPRPSPHGLLPGPGLLLKCSRLIICLRPNEFNSRASCRKLHLGPKSKSHSPAQFYCGYLSVDIGIRRRNDSINWRHKAQDNCGSQSSWAGLLNDRDVN